MSSTSLISCFLTQDWWASMRRCGIRLPIVMEFNASGRYIDNSSLSWSLSGLRKSGIVLPLDCLETNTRLVSVQPLSCFITNGFLISSSLSSLVHSLSSLFDFWISLDYFTGPSVPTFGSLSHHHRLLCSPLLCSLLLSFWRKVLAAIDSSRCKHHH